MTGGFPAFPSAAAYRIVNARAPASLLDKAHGGDAHSAALISVTLTIAGGKIREIAPSGIGASAADLPIFDLDGGMVWSACADLHTHLDKGQIWNRAPNTSGSWRDALAIVGQDRAANWSADDVSARMDFSLRAAYAHGSAAVRTHIDSIGPQASISWPVFAAMRDRWAGRIALQAVSLATLDDYQGKAGAALADLVAEHGGILGAVVIDTSDPGDKLDRLFTLARDRDLDLDFHADETDNPDSNGLEAIAEATIRYGWEGRVTAGHCCSLAMRREDQAERTIARVAAAGMTVVSLPMCNMYLQDRQAAGRTPRWRGVTLVNELAAAGVPVSVASDNIRDPFYAYGDLDPVEVFAQAVRIAHLDHPLDGWVRAVTATPSAVMGIPGGGLLRPDGGADLILFRARDWSELLARPAGPRLVVRDGKRLTDDPPDYRELDALLR